jgi:polyhydroxyalkanoate synthase
VKRFWNLATLPIREKPKVGSTPADVVHAENKWKLLRYRSDRVRHARPIVLVPSLINRHYVLDLMPGKSFAEYLVGAGHDVYVIDWGTPGPEDRWLSFDAVCDRYLGRALRVATNRSGSRDAHLLGYCLGGTLAAIHAAARPGRVASLTAIAAPIGFRDDGLLSAWTRTKTFDLDVLVEALGNVPWPLLQGAFHLLRPTMLLSKTVHLLDRAWNDEFLDGFLALETWGNDNVSFPGEAYKRYVEELYRKDALLGGSFRLSGRRVSLSSIEVPVLAVTFEHDNIVPPKSAAVLLEKVSGPTERIHLPGGHVGAMVSRSAAATLWPKLSGWWAAQDAVAAGARRLRAAAAPRTGRRPRAS